MKICLHRSRLENSIGFKGCENSWLKYLWILDNLWLYGGFQLGKWGYPLKMVNVDFVENPSENG